MYLRVRKVEVALCIQKFVDFQILMHKKLWKSDAGFQEKELSEFHLLYRETAVVRGKSIKGIDTNSQLPDIPSP
jgi:hypothetical protein